jgi:hypothetical protein
MFRFEKEMIPVLKENLSKHFETQHFATEFNSGNGIADLVFTTKFSDESLMLNDYSQMSLFFTYFNQKKNLKKEVLFQKCNDKKGLKKLLDFLMAHNYIISDDNYFIQIKRYKPHTENLISVEAKLKDWKAGIYQALRYQFFSHKSFLAYPSQNIDRVNTDLLRKYNIGLIAVGQKEIKVLLDPIERKPLDLISYCILSENFARRFKKNSHKKFA